jgi:hypothetical protein
MTYELIESYYFELGSKQKEEPFKDTFRHDQMVVITLVRLCIFEDSVKGKDDALAVGAQMPERSEQADFIQS